MEKFSWFVLPFAAGFHFLLLWLVVRWIQLWRGIPAEERARVKKNIISRKTLSAAKEIGSEVLLHRKIFGMNPLLGWMHMSFALGWFLLIVFGKIETLLFSSNLMNPVWYPLFFKFFEPGKVIFPGHSFLQQAMDFCLLLILTGQMIALFKRLKPKAAGLKLHTRHSFFNRMALTWLWFIFPLRLLAESSTAALHGGGGFLTGTLGKAMESLPFTTNLEHPLWWAYSTALGLFFAVLPFSRYLHIPMEAVLILLKKWGVTDVQTLTQAETLSCSACGLCLNRCPLATNGIAMVQPVYFIERLRGRRESLNDLYQCLQCGQCTEVCPVSVRNDQIRQLCKQRKLQPEKTDLIAIPYESPTSLTTDVVLFTGCMGKLAPHTTKAMETIFEAANLRFHWIDKDIPLCCGRPLALNGNIEAATRTKQSLLEKLQNIRFQLLVTTCPICYNMLKTDFPEGKVLHHTQYIHQLVSMGTIRLSQSFEKITYHAPCELSRGAQVTQQPIETLKQASNLHLPANNGIQTNCCGGALAGIGLNDGQRMQMAKNTATELEDTGADTIVTACPLCKKTIGRATPLAVKDLAQIVATQLQPTTGRKQIISKDKKPQIVCP